MVIYLYKHIYNIIINTKKTKPRPRLHTSSTNAPNDPHGPQKQQASRTVTGLNRRESVKYTMQAQK